MRIKNRMYEVDNIYMNKEWIYKVYEMSGRWDKEYAVCRVR